MIESLDELERVRDACRRVVARRALAVAATSMVPLPGIDIAADVGLLTVLLPRISASFGLSARQVSELPPHVGSKVMLLAAGMGNGVIGRSISRRIVRIALRRVARRLAIGSAARFVPVAGSLAAAGLGYAAVRSVGMAHVEDCYRTVYALIGAARIEGDSGSSSG